jgi:hypothetical protein
MLNIKILTEIKYISNEKHEIKSNIIDQMVFKNKKIQGFLY